MSAETNESNASTDTNVSITNEEKTALDLITGSISCCLTKGDTVMSQEVTEAARKYYLSIINNNDMPIDEKRHKIYQDLVMGTLAKTSLNINKNDDKLCNDNEDDNKRSALSLSYRVGLYSDSDVISKVNGKIIVVGQYKENDIYIPSNHVSRIHCFMFAINGKLIILDGWSKCGTSTINVAANSNSNIDEKEEKRALVSSLPKQRNILQYNMTDTIHIKLGNSHWGTDIIINPKTCIVCTEKARIIRLKCGHQVLCSQCYNKMNENVSSSQCPICRQPFGAKLNVKHSHNANNINPAISAGVHTYTFTTAACTVND